MDLRLKSVTLKKQVLKRRMDLEGLGEELRVLYVAMTRAKRKLIISYVKEKNGKSKSPSRFVGELFIPA